MCVVRGKGFKPAGQRDVKYTHHLPCPPTYQACKNPTHLVLAVHLGAPVDLVVRLLRRQQHIALVEGGGLEARRAGARGVGADLPVIRVAVVEARLCRRVGKELCQACSVQRIRNKDFGKHCALVGPRTLPCHSGHAVPVQSTQPRQFGFRVARVRHAGATGTHVLRLGSCGAGFFLSFTKLNEPLTCGVRMAAAKAGLLARRHSRGVVANRAAVRVGAAAGVRVVGSVTWRAGKAAHVLPLTSGPSPPALTCAQRSARGHKGREGTRPASAHLRSSVPRRFAMQLAVGQRPMPVPRVSKQHEPA